MFETDSELTELQALLDASLSRSTGHLRSIVDNRLTAAQLSSALSGMCVLAVATVTADGEPRISAVDGHFWHGRWVFGTAGTAAKAQHLRARPAVSVAHIRGEELGVFSHGTAEMLYPGDHPDWPAVLDHLTKHYGESPLSFGDDIVYYRLQPTWMVVYGGAGQVGS
ncbi:MAG: pyridoxamine 5'-phosphate oxidase family protein [Propionibacteriales bacterium]|nr:pyridoxamine 5'-phosphate oxidase family protein [Propionibacteriales bacterium]